MRIWWESRWTKTFWSSLSRRDAFPSSVISWRWTAKTCPTGEPWDIERRRDMNNQPVPMDIGNQEENEDETFCDQDQGVYNYMGELLGWTPFDAEDWNGMFQTGYSGYEEEYQEGIANARQGGKTGKKEHLDGSPTGEEQGKRKTQFDGQCNRSGHWGTPRTTAPIGRFPLEDITQGRVRAKETTPPIMWRRPPRPATEGWKAYRATVVDVGRAPPGTWRRSACSGPPGCCPRTPSPIPSGTGTST